MNCLEFALDEWDNDSTVDILYDGDHVIVITTDDKVYDQKGTAQITSRYLPLKDYGYYHLAKSFTLNWHYDDMLRRYLRVPNESVSTSFRSRLIDYYSAHSSLSRTLDWATEYYDMTEDQLFKFITDEYEDDRALTQVINFTKTNLNNGTT